MGWPPLVGCDGSAGASFGLVAVEGSRGAELFGLLGLADESEEAVPGDEARIGASTSLTEAASSSFGPGTTMKLEVAAIRC